jgi:hypothetical protein
MTRRADLGAVAFPCFTRTNRSVTIHVELDNPVRRLYERLGFVDVEQRGLYTLMRWTADSSTGEEAYGAA